ncbi:hypothetical protein [Nonomuraea sp. SYSU D8015]|uniref:hypothetical protein n=1 Tax=Nonomuraea sp. SYSU D8015 TaxID=2593644 RepID=UPI0016609AB0|nr:hypothetical protein [Nonomuraea sp. SYSU D8015]
MTIRPVLIALVVLALPATACSIAGQNTPAAAGRAGSATPAAPRGVVTVAEAKAILDQWGKAEKNAARQGGADWTATHAGLAEEISTADSQLTKSLGEPLDWAEQPIVKPRFAIPGKVSGAPWFMAEFRRKGGSLWTQVIFKKTSAGWRVVAMSQTTSKSRPPAAVRDKNGLATVVAPDDGAGLIASPQQIAQAHTRLLSTFGQDRTARRIFTANATPRRNAAVMEREREQLSQGRWTAAIRSQPTPEVYALRTSAGGALVWYGIRQQDVYVARPGANTTMNFTDRHSAAASRGERFRRKAVRKIAAMYLAVVPKSPSLVRTPSEWATYLSITGS